MFQSLLTAALLCAPAQPVQDDAAIFPPASGPLTIEIGADAPGMNFLQLLRAYGELTDQHITFGSEARQLLEGSKVHLDRTVTVPTEEVQTFVEHLLVRSGFAIHVLKSDGVRLLEVESLATAARNNFRANARRISSDRIDVARAHPAVLFMTTLTLPNTDVRQVSNSMRTMITDANTQQMLPAGNTNSMVLVGFGAQLAELVGLLEEVDAAAGQTATEDSTRVVELIVLEKAKAEELAAVLNDLIQHAGATQQVQGGAMPSSPQTRVVADQRTNSLLLTGDREGISSLKSLIAQLDV